MSTFGLGLARALAVALSILLAAGCAAARQSLAGTEWRLSAWSVSSLYPGDFGITMSIDADRIGGNAGVNGYGGAYTLGRDDAFSTGDLVTTLIAGPEPAMRAERIYLELLQHAARYAVGEGTLTLSDQRGNALLIFERAVP